MKKSPRFAFMAILALAMVFAVVHMALAQDQGAGDKRDVGQGDGHGKGSHFGGFKKKLGLTDDQETQLKALFKSRGEEIKPLRDQLQLDRDKLRLLVDKNASESELTGSMDKVSGDQKAFQAAREKFLEKMKGILTPKQQAQMMVLGRGGRHGGFGRHGRGGQCGWGKPGMGRHWGGQGDKGKKLKEDKPKDSDADQT